MDLKQLTERAMEIRQQFAAGERDRGGREWTKEEVMQGFVGDVGDLMKLVMAKSGRRQIAAVDEKLAHELADCLWSVLVLAKLYNVDLEQAFSRTMDEISASMVPRRAEPANSDRPIDSAAGL
jgi:NTP pyrophosphatase (non-canonical NTP hydrolase)